MFYNLHDNVKGGKLDILGLGVSVWQRYSHCKARKGKTGVSGDGQKIFGE